MVHGQKTHRQNMKKINMKKRLEPEGSTPIIVSEKQTKRTIS